MDAVRNRRLKTAKSLLDNGVDINEKTVWGVTALILCAIRNLVMLEFLLGRLDVDVSLRNINRLDNLSCN